MKWIALAVATLAFAGCGGLKRSEPEPVVYVLTPPVAETGPVLPADLLVLQPVAVPTLATARIATRWPGNRIDYYAGASWSAELGRVVQSALVVGMRDSGRVRSVEADPGRFRATHMLGVEVTHLEADYTAGSTPVARVSMTATLARSPDRKALASWTVTTEQGAAANTLSAVVAALDQAFGQAARDIVMRTADTIAAEPPGPP